MSQARPHILVDVEAAVVLPHGVDLGASQDGALCWDVTVAVVELHSALALPPALAGGLEDHLGTNSQPSGAHTSWA